EYLARHALQGVPGDADPLLGAKDQPDRRILVGTGPVMAGVVEVQVHLADVASSDSVKFQIDQHEAAKPAVKKDEIDAEPLVIDAQPLLAADEGEIVPQLQQERFQMTDQRFFKIAF